MMLRRLQATLLAFCGALGFAATATAAPTYELLLKGGRVIDPKNGVDGIRDVAISDHRIAAVSEKIPAASAIKVIDATGLVVIPGMIDIHAHVLAPPGPSSLGGNLWPDSHAQRACTTTMVDPGTIGWRDFAANKAAVIDVARTRILVLLNIVGHGMASRAQQQDLADMDPKAAADMARANPTVVVGFKTAHFDGPSWVAVDRVLEAGRLANLPVMVDFGVFRPERPFETLVTEKLRPGDIYTHFFLAHVPLLDDKGHVRPYLFEARKRGVLFDLGHGQGSFLFRQAVPAVKQGFLPDTISTDLHAGSMNSGMKDLPNVMSKLFNMGVSLPDLVRRVTVNAASAIHRPELGNLSVGAPADIAVFRVEHGQYAFVDAYKTRMDGKLRLACEVTIRDGLVQYEREGRGRPLWNKLGNYQSQGDPRWDGTGEDPRPVAKPATP